MKLSVISKSLRVSLAIRNGESPSEYERAFSLADMLMPQFLECMDAGMPRSEIVSHLMIGARVKREVATITICKKLKKIGYAPKVADDDDDDAPVEQKLKPVKSEVSKESGAKQKASPVPALKPVQSAPAPAPATSASAESDQPVDKWAHLRGNNIIVGKGFLGEEDRWMTPEEIKADKDRRAAIERASIISAELSKKT